MQIYIQMKPSKSCFFCLSHLINDRWQPEQTHDVFNIFFLIYPKYQTFTIWLLSVQSLSLEMCFTFLSWRGRCLCTSVQKVTVIISTTANVVSVIGSCKRIFTHLKHFWRWTLQQSCVLSHCGWRQSDHVSFDAHAQLALAGAQLHAWYTQTFQYIFK